MWKYVHVCIYMYTYICTCRCMHVYIYIYMYIYTCKYVYVCMCPYVYVVRYSWSHLGCHLRGLQAQSSNVSFGGFRKLRFVSIVQGCHPRWDWLYMYVYVCEYTYAGVCIYIYMYMYGWVCTCMYVDTCKCMWGALSPPAVWPQGVLFLSEWEHRIWLVHGVTLRAGDLQLPHSFDRGYHIPLSVSITVVYPPQVVLSCTPTLRTYCWPSTNNKRRESNKLAFCSSLTTSTLVPNPITTDSYFLTLNGPASNTYAKVT